MAQAPTLSLKRLNIISLGDLEFAMELRNDNKAMFFNSKSVTWTQHIAWHKAKFNDPFFTFLIVWLGDLRVGTIAFENTASGTFLQNLCVHHHYRGRGIARWAITQLMREYRFIIAQVKPSNKSVIKMYEELGFWRVR